MSTVQQGEAKILSSLEEVSKRLNAAEARIKELEMEYSYFRGWKDSAWKMAAVIAAILLAWVGATTFIQVPSLVKDAVTPKAIAEAQVQLESAVAKANNDAQMIEKAKKNVIDLTGPSSDLEKRTKDLENWRANTVDQVIRNNNSISVAEIRPLNRKDGLRIYFGDAKNDLRITSGNTISIEGYEDGKKERVNFNLFGTTRPLH